MSRAIEAGEFTVRGPIELQSYGKPPTEPRARPPYEVTVTRDDKWWMITAPELAGYVRPDGATNYSDTTQAREPGEIASQARDFICTVTGVSPSEVDLHIVIPHPSD